MTAAQGRAHIASETLRALRDTHPELFAAPARVQARRTFLAVLALAVVLAAMGKVGMLDPARLANGMLRLGDVLSFMLPPATHGRLPSFLYAMVETVSMAFLGSIAAALLAVPVGVLGAANVSPHGLLRFAVRRLLDFVRGIDVLIWALVFVNVVGLGPFAGVLALVVSDTGTLGKIYAEAIETAGRRPMEGVRAAGGNRLQVLRFGLLPQVLPVLLSNALYSFESNTRSATILGVVGAGGIGLQLSDRIRVGNWDEASFIILIILVAVAVIDGLSKRLRQRVIHGRDALAARAEDRRASRRVGA